MQLNVTPFPEHAQGPGLDSPAPLEKEGRTRGRCNFILDFILLGGRGDYLWLGIVAHSCNSSVQETGVGWSSLGYIT